MLCIMYIYIYIQLLGVSQLYKRKVTESQASQYCLHYLSVMNAVAFVSHVSVDGIQKILRSGQDID